VFLSETVCRCATEDGPNSRLSDSGSARSGLAATRRLALPLTEASVKVSDGDPSDGDGPDAALGLWAGRLPVVATWGAPVADPLLPAGIEPPPHIASRSGRPVAPGNA